MKAMKGILIFVLCMALALPAAALPNGAAVTKDNLTKAQLTQMIVDVLVNNLPYAYSQFKPVDDKVGYFQNLEASGVSGNSGEKGVRPNADYALVLAFIYKYAPEAALPMVPTSALNSTRVQLTREMLKATFLQSLRYGYRTHRANAMVKCTDNSYWGSFSGTTVWESSMWAQSLAVAAHIMWDELSSADKVGMQKLIVGEANQQLTRSVPTQYISDTKAEENGWDTNILACAVTMFPDNANAAAWDEKCKSFGYNSYSTSADAYDETMVDGKKGKEWYIGATLFDDYTLENHNFFHTSYLTVVNQELSESYLMYKMALPEDKKATFPLPDALRHNVSEVWDSVLGRLATSDSELAMPNGNDWSMYLLDQFESYAALASIYGRSEAHMLASRCIQMIRARQMTAPDGAFMLNPDVANRRMGVSARRMVFSYLLYDNFAPDNIGEESITWDEYSKNTSAARNYSYAKILRASSSDRFATFSWYESNNGAYKSYMGNITPDTNDDLDASFMVYPYKSANRGNFTGTFAVSGKAQNATLTAYSNKVYKDGFATIGALSTEDGALTQYSVFYAPENSAAVIYADKVVAKENVTVSAEKGLPLAITVDPFTKSERTVITEDTQSVTNGQTLNLYNGNWANIDNKLGVVVSGSGSLASGERSLSNSVYVMQLYGSYDTSARTFAKGASVADRAQVVYSNQSAQDTAQCAKTLRELSTKASWKAISCADDEGREYLMVAHLFTERDSDAKLDLPLTSENGSPVLGRNTIVDTDRSIVNFYDSDLTVSGEEIKAYIVTDGALNAYVSKDGTLYVENPASEDRNVTLRLRKDGTLCEETTVVAAGSTVMYDGESVSDAPYAGVHHDVAYSKDVTVSSHMPQDTKNLINDNNPQTAWTAKETGDASVTFSLDCACAISGVNVTGNADSVKVYVGNTPAATAEDFVAQGAIGNLEFSEAYGKYVTLKFSSSERVSISEAEIYGEEIATTNVEFYLVNESGSDIASSLKIKLPVGKSIDARDYAPPYVNYKGKKYILSQSLNTDADMIFVVRNNSDVEVYYEDSAEEADGLLLNLTFDDFDTGFSGALGKTVQNGTVSASDDAICGKAAYFDGSADTYLAISDFAGGSLLTDRDAITITFFNKKDTAASAADGGWIFFAAPNSSAQTYPYEHYLALFDQGTNMTVERYNNSGTRPTNAMSPSSLNWKHVALVIEAAQTKLYVDGVLKQTVASAYKLSDILGDASVAYIGRANWGSGEWYRGYLDDFRIYDSALDDETIAFMGTKMDVPVTYETPEGEVLLSETISQYGGASGCGVRVQLRKMINGTLYEFVSEGSTSSTSMSPTAALKLIYRPITSTTVTVHYIDDHGETIKPDAFGEVAIGETFKTDISDGFEENINIEGSIYRYSETLGGSIVATEAPFEVTLVYTYLGESTPKREFTALRGATIKRSTGQSHENATEYANRIMADSRTTSSSGTMYGLVGFDASLSGAVATKATVTFTSGADNNQTTATKYALYAMEDLDSTWTRATISGITEVPDALPIAEADIKNTLAAGVMQSVVFDITDYVNAHTGKESFNFMVVSQSSESYGVFYSESTQNAPVMAFEGYVKAAPDTVGIDLSSGTATASSPYAHDMTIYIAQYDANGILICVNSKTEKSAKSIELTVTYNSAAASARAFVWNAMTPYTEIAEELIVK